MQNEAYRVYRPVEGCKTKLVQRHKGPFFESLQEGAESSLNQTVHLEKTRYITED